MTDQPVLDALSISQPWAWLIVSRLKRVENRQWGAAQLAQARARVGRRFAVHAAKSYDAHAAEDLADYGIVVPERPALAAGAIVGVATLARVITVAEALADVDLEDQHRRLPARPNPPRHHQGAPPVTDLYLRASDLFKGVIATAHTATTLDHLAPLDRLQFELAAWEERQPFWSASVLPVALGVGEECGELAEAKTHAEATDAVGNIAIYVCQVATRERLAMSEILAEAGRIADRALASWPAANPWRTLMARVGRVNHLALKRHQKIREGTLPDAEYRALLADALAELLAVVELAAGVSVAECFADTAPTVLARDWSADRAGGGR